MSNTDLTIGNWVAVTGAYLDEVLYGHDAAALGSTGRHGGNQDGFPVHPSHLPASAAGAFVLHQDFGPLGLVAARRDKGGQLPS